MFHYGFRAQDRSNACLIRSACGFFQRLYDDAVGLFHFLIGVLLGVYKGFPSLSNLLTGFRKPGFDGRAVFFDIGLDISGRVRCPLAKPGILKLRRKA